MSTRRKTAPIDTLVEHANRMLATPDSTLRLRGVEPDGCDAMTPEQAFRTGIAALLEVVLHRTDAYRGFGYLDVDHTVDPPHIPDETRRRYS